MVVGPPKPKTIHLSLIFWFFECLPFSMFALAALKLSRMTNFDMLFITIGFICLSDKNKFMLFSGSH